VSDRLNSALICFDTRSRLKTNYISKKNKNMKLFILLLSFVASVNLTQAQNETIYLETCGTLDISTLGNPNYRPKVAFYTGWDVQAPVAYTSDDSYASLRQIDSTTNHIWFPADKDADLIISNISGVGYTNLKLSFDVATHILTGSDANKVAVFINDVELTIPSKTLWVIDSFSTVADIPIPSADVIKLKFAYTASSNTVGYRLDNFKITGDKVTSGLLTISTDVLDVKVIGKKLSVINASTSFVEIFSTLGAKITTLELVNGSTNLNLSKGLYIVRSGKKSAKIML